MGEDISSKSQYNLGVELQTMAANHIDGAAQPESIAEVNIDTSKILDTCTKYYSN